MNYTENLTMKKPAYGDNADVADLNYNADILDSYVYNNRQMQAPEYNSQNTYNTGDIVTHNGAMYICLADNVTGAWDSTKWSATTLAEQIELAKQSGGESALADLEDVNLTNPSNGQLLQYNGSEWVNGDVTVTKTASGNPIEFTDGADAPLIKCTTEIQGYQEGTGTPSPDNVRPIVAYNQSTISVEDENEVVQQTSTATFSQSIYRGNADFVGGSVECDMPVIDLGDLTWTYNATGEYFITSLNTWNRTNRYAICSHFDVVLWKSAASALINADDKKAYYQTSNDNLFIKYSDYNNDVPAFTSAMSGIKFAYPYKAPTTETITPTNLPIKSLFGYNHIESSTGDMEIEYLKSNMQPIINLISASQHVYSTQEQIVGTWIDGSTMYEKSFKADNISDDSNHVLDAALTQSAITLLPGTEIIVSCTGTYNTDFINTVSDNTFGRVIANVNGLCASIVGYSSLSSQLGTCTLYVTARYIKKSVSRSLSKSAEPEEPTVDKVDELKEELKEEPVVEEEKEPIEKEQEESKK